MAVGCNGMVATAHPFASSAGLQILHEGGNAFDAAITAAFVEDVILSPMTTLGGDSFAIGYTHSTKELFALNGSGAAPGKATVESFKERGYDRLPLRGNLSSSVPGEVHTLMTLHERFGSMPIKRLLKPAIHYAENGFPVNERLKYRIAKARPHLEKFPETAAIFLPNNKLPEVGSILVQKDLATTLKVLRDKGLHEFYQGEIAEKIVRHIEKNSGLIDYLDLFKHETEMYNPIFTDYKGYRIFETAPPSQGLIVLEALNILEGYQLGEMAIDSPEVIHLMNESKKLAYSDRLKYCGDPRFVDLDIDQLLSKEYARTLRSQIDPHSAMNHYNGLVEYANGDTTYLTVADRDGNCISFIHSLSGVEFGSCEVVEGTGIILNQRLGRGFTLDQTKPNALEAGKRTMHTLNAYMIFKDGIPRYTGGTPGGDQQPQWNIQTIVNLIDFDLNVQQATEYPRWYNFPGADEANLDSPFELRMENRFNPLLYDALERKGHRIKLIDPYANGGVQLIELNWETGTYLGGSDPRIGGIALGY